jgi:phosphate transport system protein
VSGGAYFDGSDLGPTVEPGEAVAGEELRRGFHQQLDDLRDAIASLAATVTEQVPRATDILLSQDLEGAEYLILGDDEMDAKALQLEERCYEVLALQSPVASDLRRVVAALRIIADVERSSDLTVNICKAARRIYGQRLDPRLRGIIQKMGTQARQLFKEATEAYLTDDAIRAAALADMDVYLDHLQREFVQAIFQSHSEGTIDLQVAVQLAVVARFYERIGDHAVNIGERVRFLVTGWVHERDGAARYSERQAGSDLE